MEELVKIRDISSKYDISTRALRYYEDVGLIRSTRSEDYAYRLYDRDAVKRLEQIMILRKLNISIKDIQLIFNTSGSEVVLEILQRKIDSIEGEIFLLNELKDIIIEFIHQIKQADFSQENNVRMLYDRAAKIEKRIFNISYEGNPAKQKISKLLEVTEKLKKGPDVRIVQINPFKAFSSGLDTFDNVMGAFQQWQEEHNHLVKKLPYGAPDFLWFEEEKATWIWAVENWVTEKDVKPYELIVFEGGLYAAAMSVDGDDDINGRVYAGILEWLKTSGFELDERQGHRALCHMLNPTEEIKKALGYHQLDIYVPIKIRKE